VVNDWAMFSLAPGQRHVAVLGNCGGYYGFVGDGDTGIAGKELTYLPLPLVDGKEKAGFDARIEVVHVVIQIMLADLGVGVVDVHD
jgi:hypothetical protein